MIKPRKLVAGDRVAIIAPARKVMREQIEVAIQTLQHWGLQVELGENVFSSEHPYLAATDDQRLSDFQNAVNNHEIKAIFSARGGYGVSRIVDALDFSALQNNPKWVIGFSDITSVHLRLYREEIMSIHGTMPILFGQDDSNVSVESLRKTLFENSTVMSFPATDSNRFGNAAGRLVGGNLSLIIDSLGTPSEPDTEGCLLLIEEIDEYKYRLDRMMNHLRRAGKLSALKGLVVGQMTEIKESELPFRESIEQIIFDKVKGTNFPIAFGCPSGHENPNFAWIHGEFYELDVSPAGTRLSTRGYAL